MDKKIAGLLGAAAALTTMTAANAAPAPMGTLQASTYADLLNPVPNALNQLIADDTARATAGGNGVQVAQIDVEIGRRHHHHHHHRHRRSHHHHHHGFMAVPSAIV
jgi:hypothetical protein